MPIQLTDWMVTQITKSTPMGPRDCSRTRRTTDCPMGSNLATWATGMLALAGTLNR